MLINANPAFVKPTSKTLDDFIRGANSRFFKDFFINRMDAMLQAYAPGSPEMKPDVITQTKELEQTLSRLREQEQSQQAGAAAESPAILMHQEGKEPIALSNTQVLGVIQTQQAELKTLNARVSTLEAEKIKGDVMFQALLSSYIDATSEDGASNEALVRQCLKDVAERDDKLKRTKALYIKSINESADLKKQITELRTQIQSIQSAAVLQQQEQQDKVTETASPDTVSASDPIRLVID